jgi:mannose-6-phosphate isomerase-like protein (cupin superfamily)
VSFAIKNLRDVEDLAPASGFGEVQQARFAFKSLGAQDTGLAYHVLRGGKRQAFAHRHEAAEEIYVVLSGTGRMKLDDEIVDVGPMDAIRVAPQVARAFEAGPEALELLVFGPRHQGDGEIIQDEGFWGD